MQKLFNFIISILLLVGLQNPALAAKPAKLTTPAKDRLVLMPLRVPDEDANLSGSMEAALVQGLQIQYEVFSGEQVAQRAKAIFLKESRNAAKKECDETRCMQDIAIAFQAELIATANVTHRDGGYFLALSIQNIFDNKVVYSNSIGCKGCDSFQVIDKLKQLSNLSLQVPIQTNEVESVSVSNASSAENELWSAVTNGNSVEEYNLYLKRYPRGQFKDLANIRLGKLEAEKNARNSELERREKSNWESSVKYPSISKYENYLHTYPQGKYVSLAKRGIEDLKAEQSEQAEKTESELWDKSNSSDESKLQNYIRRYPAGRYTAEAKGKLLTLERLKLNPEYADSKTGLIWRRCVEGMEYIAGDCHSKAIMLTYTDADKHSAEVASKTGVAWRLPTKDELNNIVLKDSNSFSPAIDKVIFPNTPNRPSWTSSLSIKQPSETACRAVTINFSNGDQREEYCIERYPIRLVRKQKF